MTWSNDFTKDKWLRHLSNQGMMNSNFFISIRRKRIQQYYPQGIRFHNPQMESAVSFLPSYLYYISLVLYNGRKGWAIYIVLSVKVGWRADSTRWQTGNTDWYAPPDRNRHHSGGWERSHFILSWQKCLFCEKKTYITMYQRIRPRDLNRYDPLCKNKPSLMLPWSKIWEIWGAFNLGNLRGFEILLSPPPPGPD